MQKKKTFNNLPVQIKDKLYIHYLPKFKGEVKTSNEELYLQIRKILPYAVGESCIRKNLKSRYDNSGKKENPEFEELMQENAKLKEENKELKKALKAEMNKSKQVNLFEL